MNRTLPSDCLLSLEASRILRSRSTSEIPTATEAVAGKMVVFESTGAHRHSFAQISELPPNLGRGSIVPVLFVPSPRSAVPPPNVNSFVQLGSDYIRMCGVRRPFRKFLSMTSSDDPDLDPPAAPGSKANGILNETDEAILLIDGDPEKGEVKIALKAQNRAARVRQRRTKLQESKELKYRLCEKKKLIAKRHLLCKICVSLALLGIFLAVLDAELCANRFTNKDMSLSLILRSQVMASTIALAVVIFHYQVVELQIQVFDTGADDWRVAITYSRVVQLIAEELVCIVCPVPGTGYFKWTYIVTDSCFACQHGQPSGSRDVVVPVDIILTLPMFLRCYLIGRFMVLESHQFRDAATRTIAAMNRVSVDFKFVLKTMITENPLLVIVAAGVSYWISVSWMYMLCERNSISESYGNQPFLESLWFVVITLTTIGYGDVVPNTYCGRALAVATAIMGAALSSACIAIIGQKLDLTRAEKHVNAFMADSKLAKARKNSAACILQQTWHIYKLRYLKQSTDSMKIRLHQRKFLSAIKDFRRIKWEQRRLNEQTNTLVDIAKVQQDMTTALSEIQQCQKTMMFQQGLLTSRLNKLQSAVEHLVSKSNATTPI